jgi:hypothetical protein
MRHRISSTPSVVPTYAVATYHDALCAKYAVLHESLSKTRKNPTYCIPNISEELTNPQISVGVTTRWLFDALSMADSPSLIQPNSAFVQWIDSTDRYVVQHIGPVQYRETYDMLCV